jgi:pimeloyl-ACP methyl ester carboxylesterase
MAYATNPDGTKIHYKSFGKAGGQTVVLLQGIGLPSDVWFDLPQRIVSQGSNRPVRVLSVDNRGAGLSDKPKGLYRMRSMAADVVAVLDHAGVNRATLVGFSMGGMIAQNVAVTTPERVDGLVLMGTGPGLSKGTWPKLSAIAKLLKVGTGAGAMGDVSALLLPASERHRIQELAAEWPEVLKNKPTPPHGFFGQFTAILNHDAGKHLRNVHVPTVILSGIEDILIPPANGQALAQLLPNSHLELMPNMAHDIHLLDKEAVLRSLHALRQLPMAA